MIDLMVLANRLRICSHRSLVYVQFFSHHRVRFYGEHCRWKKRKVIPYNFIRFEMESNEMWVDLIFFIALKMRFLRSTPNIIKPNVIKLFINHYFGHFVCGYLYILCTFSNNFMHEIRHVRMMFQCRFCYKFKFCFFRSLLLLRRCSLCLWAMCCVCLFSLMPLCFFVARKVDSVFFP